MPSRDRLSDDAVARALATLPGWERRGDAIVRTFAFPTYMDGIAFVQRVAEAAERADHHPDMDVRWRKVACALSTHDRGGITELDVALAREMDAIFGASSPAS